MSHLNGLRRLDRPGGNSPEDQNGYEGLHPIGNRETVFVKFGFPQKAGAHRAAQLAEGWHMTRGCAFVRRHRASRASLVRLHDMTPSRKMCREKRGRFRPLAGGRLELNQRVPK